jgi:hypothetical protein
MTVSYIDVFGIEPVRARGDDIRPGDLVRTGANLFPHFSVVAVAEGKVWVRNTQTGDDGIAPLDRCHRIDCAPSP